MISDQNVILQFAIFNAFHIDTLSLNPRIAPIRSKRGIRVAVSGGTLNLEATRWTEKVLPLWSYLNTLPLHTHLMRNLRMPKGSRTSNSCPPAENSAILIFT